MESTNSHIGSDRNSLPLLQETCSSLYYPGRIQTAGMKTGSSKWRSGCAKKDMIQCNVRTYISRNEPRGGEESEDYLPIHIIASLASKSEWETTTVMSVTIYNTYLVWLKPTVSTYVRIRTTLEFWGEMKAISSGPPAVFL